MADAELLTALQEEIGRRMIILGDKLEELEDELINEQPLSDDAKAALWLFAWSHIPPADQRREANLHLGRIRSAL